MASYLRSRPGWLRGKRKCCSDNSHLNSSEELVIDGMIQMAGVAKLALKSSVLC